MKYGWTRKAKWVRCTEIKKLSKLSPSGIKAHPMPSAISWIFLSLLFGEDYFANLNSSWAFQLSWCAEVKFLFEQVVGAWHWIHYYFPCLCTAYHRSQVCSTFYILWSGAKLLPQLLTIGLKLFSVYLEYCGYSSIREYSKKKSLF